MDYKKKWIEKKDKDTIPQKSDSAVETGGYIKHKIYYFIMGVVKYISKKIACIPSHTIRNMCYRFILGMQLEP